MHHIYFYDSINNKESKNMIENLEALNLKLWSKEKIKINEDKLFEIQDSIEASIITLFFIKSSFLEEELFNQVMYAKTLKKCLIIVTEEEDLLEKITDKNDLKVIQMKNLEHVYLTIRGIFKSEETCMNTKITEIKSGQNIMVKNVTSIIDIKEKNEFIAINEDEIFIFDRERIEFKRKVFLYYYFKIESFSYFKNSTKFCWINHLSVLCGLDQVNNVFVLYNSDYDIVEAVQISSDKIYFAEEKNESIEYNVRNKNIYLYDAMGSVRIYNITKTIINNYRLNFRINYLKIHNDDNRIFFLDDRSK